MALFLNKVMQLSRGDFALWVATENMPGAQVPSRNVQREQILRRAHGKLAEPHRAPISPVRGMGIQAGTLVSGYENR